MYISKKSLSFTPFSVEYTTVSQLIKIHIGALIRIVVHIHWLRTYGLVETNVCDGVGPDWWRGISRLYPEAGETWSRQISADKDRALQPQPRGPCLVTK